MTDEAFLLLPSVSDSCRPEFPSSLQQLNLGKSTITDVSMFRVAFLVDLKEIHLHWCEGITDKGIDILTRHCPMLSFMDLRACEITDATLFSISRHCKLLRTLDISWCIKVTDDGIRHLSPLSGSACEHLEALRIIWCEKLTEAALSVIEEISTLVTLQVSGSTSVSIRGMHSLDVLRGHGVNVTVS